MEENKKHDSDLISAALIEWATENDSFVVNTPSGRFYALFFEPGGESPRMQFIGSSPSKAYAFVRLKPSNIYK